MFSVLRNLGFLKLVHFRNFRNFTIFEIAKCSNKWNLHINNILNSWNLANGENSEMYNSIRFWRFWNVQISKIGNLHICPILASEIYKLNWLCKLKSTLQLDFRGLNLHSRISNFPVRTTYWIFLSHISLLELHSLCFV